MLLCMREKKIHGCWASRSSGSREGDGHACSWEEKLSSRKEINGGVALGSDLRLPLFCFSGRSARQEVRQHTIDTRLGGTANRARAGIPREGIMHEHEDQCVRKGNLSNSKVIVSVFWD